MSFLKKIKGLKGILRKKFKTKQRPSEKGLEFEIHEPKHLVVIPKVEKKQKNVNLQYPLLEPYASAHIKWSELEGELIYRIVEPELRKNEKEIYEKMVEALMELVDVELSAVKNPAKAMDYLEDKVKKIIYDLDIDLNKTQFGKIMYHIYKNFVGLGKIEPLMYDPYIEDIACDGIGTPIYLVHKRFGSIRTNIVFEEEDELKDFIVKLAERCGRYVSYAEPLLDGSLPDGSRVQASLAADVTTKGPTFSIRKFTKEPYSPIDMIDLGTASPKLLAYLWFCIENGISGLICGGVATGKTSFLNSISLFIPPQSKIVSIEDSVTGDCEIIVDIAGEKRKMEISEFIDPIIERDGEKTLDGAERAEIRNERLKIPTLSEGFEFRYATPTSVIRHKTDKDIFKITTSTGKSVKVTEDHSLFSLKDGKLVEISPKNLEEGSFVATPRKREGGQGIKYIDVLKAVRNKKRVFVEGQGVNDFFEKCSWEDLVKKGSEISENGYKWWKRNGFVRGEEFYQLLNSKKLNTENLKIRTKYRDTSISNQIKVTDDLLYLMGLWIGDGSHDYGNENVVMISNSENSVREVVSQIAKSLSISTSKKSDENTISLNSVMLYELFRGLGFEGKAATKTLPEFVYNLSNKQLGEFLRGYFSADGTVKSHEICSSSQSRKLLQEIQTLLLRFGIVSRVSNYERKDNCYELHISSQKFVIKFKKHIGFLQERKNRKIGKILNKNQAHHDTTDTLPTDKKFGERINKIHPVQWSYRNNVSNFGREYLKRLTKTSKDLKQLAESDIFWDQIVSVKKVNSKANYVYDISVPGSERFICNDFVLHNTRELNLPHENWIPSVARLGFGMPTASGKKYGEVGMFELLKESFRQNPDYVIVGEVRGEEAYVMFQGMASGHPCMGTMHAGGIDTIMRRLQSPPIELSPGLIETLDFVVTMIHAREKGKSARRVKEVIEIESVDPNTGKAITDEVFTWNPSGDNFEERGKDWILKEISRTKGFKLENIKEELERRTEIIKLMYKNNIKDWKEVSKIISQYTNNPEETLKEIKEKTEEES